MSAVREGTYLVPRIGALIKKVDLGMILLSVVQKMRYDRPTDDENKAVEAFVLGKDVFISLPTSLSALSKSRLPAAMIPLAMESRSSFARNHVSPS